MNGPQTSYPDFVPNQILTNTQLNDLREHLDLQDREGRSKLVGMGIVCGLLWEVQGPANARKVVLDDGLGLTSDGYLVCLPGATYNRVRDYLDPAVEENDTTPRYVPWRTSPTGAQREIFELVAVAAGETAPADTRVLKQVDLDARVLVLYVELEPVELRSCFVTECDNKGQKINVNMRVLLVKKSHLSAVAPCEPPLPAVRVPRLHSVVSLQSIVKSADIDAGYRRIVELVTPLLLRRIREAYDKFEAFLGLDESTHVTPVEAVFGPAVRQGTKVNQYHYDAVKEMAAAYNELVVEACELRTECCPQRDFPRHLMLGAFDESEGFRHPFYPSAVRNVVDAGVERVRKLFDRIAVMAKSIDFSAADEVRLTPSHGEQGPLGARAVPHYFPLDAADEKLWQPKMCCTAETPWSYQTSTANDDLEHDAYNRSALIRIEGHLSLACDKAHGDITKARRNHNAEFDVLVTSFDNTGPELAALRADINTLLSERDDVVVRYQALIANAVAGGTFDDAAVRDTIKMIERADGRLQALLDKWAGVRCGRALYCDTAQLEMLYADTRAELMCLLSGMLAELSAITDAAVALGDKLTPARRKQLATIIGTLRGQVRWLLDAALPPRLCGFYLPLFVARYKELLEDLTHCWLWWRSLGFPVHDEKLDKVVHRPWPPGGESVSAALLAAGRGCFHTRLARLWLLYEHVWESDWSFFPELVEHVDGLEHLGGVRRCGTFVLVCDRADTAAPLRVTADFSLSCRLPCCCDFELDKECLPVVALPHHRVVQLEAEDGAFRPVELKIGLDPAGYDPNYRRAEGATTDPPLRISLPSSSTKLGGRVRLDGGVVTYEHPEPAPGLLDTFEYLLESDHECGGKDRSEVAVLMEPQPRLPEVAVPTGGFVTGKVTFNGKRFDAVGVVVRIVELRVDIPVGVGPSGEPGFYRSDAVPAGTYRLMARFERLFSDEVTVQVNAGQDTVQDLDLAPRNGSVEIFVVDRQGGAVKGAVVALRSEERNVDLVADQPQANGAHLFADIPAGVYAAKATAPRFNIGILNGIEVRSRDVVTRKIILPPITLAIPDRYTFRLALDLGEDIEAVRERAGKLYEERYREKEKRLVRSGSNPEVAATEPYKRAVDFFEKAVTNTDIPADVLAAGYNKVASGLVRSIIHPTSDDEKKKAMRAVLIDVTSAYLDRITLDQPDELSAEVVSSLAAVKQSLGRSEITPTAFKTAWKFTDLSEQLRSTTAVKIADTIG
jgi:hypothetical protein